MSDVHKIISERFRIKERDNLPYRGMRGNRNTLVEVIRDAGFKIGAEVGVRMGEYSEVLCKAIPDLKLYCVDHYKAYVRATQSKQDEFYNIAVEKLKPYNVEFIKEYSVDAAKLLPDNSLDFVYIDGAHDFDNVIMDILAWNRKVKSGGIMSGHDYYHCYQSGVVFAVDTYTRAHNILRWYITREEYASWFWVKE